MNKKQINEAIDVIETALEETDQHANDVVQYLVNYLKGNKDEILESAEFEDFDIDEDQDIF